MSAEEILKSLIQGFGHPERVLAHVADNAVWTLFTGSQAPGGVHQGKQAIATLMNNVFGQIYQPDSVAVDILQSLGDDTQASVRFKLSAKTTWGASYCNDYAILATVAGDKVTGIFEFLDNVSAMEQLAEGSPDDLQL